MIKFQKFTVEQWEAVRATRAKCVDPIDWSQARKLIEEAGRECSAIEVQREQRRRSKWYKEALDSARGHLSRLRYRLEQMVELSPSGNDLDDLPDPGLKLLEERLKKLLRLYATWSTPFGGRRNLNFETLVNRLLYIWEHDLHGHIRASKSSSKHKAPEPIGPLVRYLRVTLKAILDYSPGPHGLEDIIDKAKKRRRSTPKKAAADGR